MASLRVCASYSSADRDRLIPVFDLLQSYGLDVWHDQRMTGADRWTASFKRELRRRRICLFFWSENSVGSEAVRAEFETARKLGSFINVRLDDCELPKFLGGLSGRNIDLHDYAFIDLDTSDVAKGIGRLVSSAASLILRRSRRQGKQNASLSAVTSALSASVITFLIVTTNDSSSTTTTTTTTTEVSNELSKIKGEKTFSEFEKIFFIVSIALNNQENALAADSIRDEENKEHNFSLQKNNNSKCDYVEDAIDGFDRKKIAKGNKEFEALSKFYRSEC